MRATQDERRIWLDRLKVGDEVVVKDAGRAAQKVAAVQMVDAERVVVDNIVYVRDTGDSFHPQPWSITPVSQKHLDSIERLAILDRLSSTAMLHVTLATLRRVAAVLDEAKDAEATQP